MKPTDRHPQDTYIDTYWAYYIDGNQNQFPVTADSAEDFWPCSRAATASCLGLVLSRSLPAAY